MGIRVKKSGRVMANIARVMDRANKASLKFLRESAEFIADEARKRAPVDTGDLENAIVAEDVAGARTTKGTFGRMTVNVGVDPSRLNLEEHEGYDYSVLMHEGEYNLGPRSEAKNAVTPEGVGPKYLERALRENLRPINERMKQIAEEITRGGNPR